MKILIVGGVAGGASAAARLRRLDEKAEIIMFERGEFISFANCGLPYYIGGDISRKSDLVVIPKEAFSARFNIDVRNFTEVTDIDRENKRVTAKNLITGEEYQESYDKLILSTGASPILPPIPGIESKRVFTLRTIPDAYRIKDFIDQESPKSAIVAGGGYIGVEMAENLKKTGLEVTIIEMADHLIAPIDYDIACDVHNYIRSKGINLILNNALKEIKEGERLTAVLSMGKIEADMLIMSVGVRPDTELALKAGLKFNPRGAIIVNEHMLTSDPDIYAVGDSVEVTEYVSKGKAFIPLAGPANKQGRIAADNICGIDSVYEGTQGSSVIKIFDMTVAATGLNERAAKAKGYNYDKVFLYSNSHASYYPNGTRMSMKVIFEKSTGKLLGAQIAGFDGVDKRMDVLATAIRANLTAKDLTRLELCYAPPFSSAKDPVNMAGYAIENILNGLVKQFHWHDVRDLPQDGSVTLLDVRTQKEYSRGHIKGSVNIPLDALRENLDKLDKNKPVYVYCHSGQRSYLACRILSGNGFDAFNLSGGYRLYESVVNASRIGDYNCITGQKC